MINNIPFIIFFTFIGLHSFTSAQCLQQQCVLRAIQQCSQIPPTRSRAPPPSPSPIPPDNSDSEYAPPPFDEYDDHPCPPDVGIVDGNVVAQPPDTPNAPVDSAPMTKTFPLGSCKMNHMPSLPYILSVHSQNTTSICFRVSKVSNWQSECSKYDKLPQCQNMLTQASKIVMSYRITQQCGSNLAIARNNGLFDWRVINKGTQVLAGSVLVYAPNDDSHHFTTSLKLFKWSGTVNNENIESIEVELNRKEPFKRNIDVDIHNYIICLNFDPNVINLPLCLRNNNFIVKYSFYDPNKTLCTVGTLLLP